MSSTWQGYVGLNRPQTDLVWCPLLLTSVLGLLVTEGEGRKEGTGMVEEEKGMDRKDVIGSRTGREFNDKGGAGYGGD